MDLKDLFIVILVVCILGIFFFGSVGSFFSHVHNAVGEFTNAEAKNEYFSVDYLEGKTDNPHGHLSDSNNGDSSSYLSESSSKDSSGGFLGFSIDQNTHSIKSSSSDSGSYSSGSSSGSKDSGGYSSGSQSSGSSSKESSSHSSKSNGWFPNLFPDKKSDNSNSSNKSIIPSNDTNSSVIPANDSNKSSNSSDEFPVEYDDYQINYTTGMVDEEGNPIILTIVSTSGNQMESGIYEVYWSKLGVINQTKIK